MLFYARSHPDDYGNLAARLSEKFSIIKDNIETTTDKAQVGRM